MTEGKTAGVAVFRIGGEEIGRVAVLYDASVEKPDSATTLRKYWAFIFICKDGKLCYNVVGVLHRQQNGMPDGTRQRSNGMLGVLCIILAVCIIVGLWIMLYDTHHFVTRRYRFASAKIKRIPKSLCYPTCTTVGMVRTMPSFCGNRSGKAGFGNTCRRHDYGKQPGKDGAYRAFHRKAEKQLSLYYTYGNHEQKIILKEEYKKRRNALKKNGRKPAFPF